MLSLESFLPVGRFLVKFSFVASKLAICSANSSSKFFLFEFFFVAFFAVGGSGGVAFKSEICDSNCSSKVSIVLLWFLRFFSLTSDCDIDKELFLQYRFL